VGRIGMRIGGGRGIVGEGEERKKGRSVTTLHSGKGLEENPRICMRGRRCSRYQYKEIPIQRNTLSSC
jgi:hypothetical protein